MEKKNFNLSIATFTFIVGGFFVLANTQGITGAVVEATGPGGTVTALTGLLLIIASAGFFVFTINYGDTHLERLVRETKEHEDVNVSKKMSELDAKEKYDQRNEDYNK